MNSRTKLRNIPHIRSNSSEKSTSLTEKQVIILLPCHLDQARCSRWDRYLGMTAAMTQCLGKMPKAPVLPTTRESRGTVFDFP